jgi:regulator of sigma E protease
MTITIITSIVLFIIAISVLAFLHELGHYLASRFFNVKVEEFGLGFPPRIVRLFIYKGTEFSLNWIPFGAFVRPKGENDPTIEGGLAAANPWARLVVLLSGPFMNIIVGALLFAGLYSYIGIPGGSEVRISQVNAGSPAELAGLHSGDILVKIQDITIDDLEKVRPVIEKNLGQEISISYQRDGKIFEIKVTPRKNPGPNEGALGIVYSASRQINFLEAIPYGFLETYEQGKQIVTLPAKLMHGDVKPEDARVVGPKGIFDIFNRARSIDQASASSSSGAMPALNTLAFIATISVALGMTNLLPIPALDGGRILFVLPELIIRKRIPARYENMVHLIGFAALLLLLTYVTAQDILNPIPLP